MKAEELRARRILAFRDLAAQELDAARLLAEGHGAQAAYFLQQSVEKLARGLLEMLDIPVGPTHNIQQLARMMDGRPEWTERFAALDELSVASTRYRYPGPKGNISTVDPKRLGELIVAVTALHEEFAAVLTAFTRKNGG
ncbi:HEPN domain-containing protein [Rhizobium sp. YJ-22]|uniref:HEPN domain-containing protein n=1 Tax=Rhizobium sp. YJ-22 TaxID=3037556 RepID=UPI002412ADC0|nr:HEPN domain-containing protein [Rhizobium sp. YJ-22]MDG3578610.1 HEPN domain-containing protein [Rhizobium sp. YJ-22]